MFKLLGAGVGALVGGGLGYAASSVFSGTGSSAADEEKRGPAGAGAAAGRSSDPNELEPKPTSLHREPQLKKFFQDLNQYRSINEAAWKESMNAADQIVFMLYNMREKTLPSQIDDGIVAQGHEENLLKHLELFYRASAQLQDMRIASDILTTKRRIESEVSRMTNEIAITTRQRTAHLPAPMASEPFELAPSDAGPAGRVQTPTRAVTQQ